ncbi:MAG: hypothetical protein LBR85_07635 [Oscillospiraceae bacterium]|nr:hypothetical protein [Oscillospiraceae bacterium]
MKNSVIKTSALVLAFILVAAASFTVGRLNPAVGDTAVNSPYPSAASETSRPTPEPSAASTDEPAIPVPPVPAPMPAPMPWEDYPWEIYSDYHVHGVFGNDIHMVTYTDRQKMIIFGKTEPSVNFTIDYGNGYADTAVETLCEDDRYMYTFSSIWSTVFKITFKDGRVMTLRDAVDGGFVTGEDLVLNDMARLYVWPVENSTIYNLPAQEDGTTASTYTSSQKMLFFNRVPPSFAVSFSDYEPPEQTETEVLCEDEWYVYSLPKDYSDKCMITFEDFIPYGYGQVMTVKEAVEYDLITGQDLVLNDMEWLTVSPKE